MRNLFFLLLIVFILTAIKPAKLFSKEQTSTKISIEAFSAYMFWENNYGTKAKYDRFGPGIYYTPKIRQEFGKLIFEMDLTLHSSQIDGPDGLTITGPDDDADSGFRTSIRRKDCSFKIGYNFQRSLCLSINVKRNWLQLNEYLKYAPQLTDKYFEKGFLFGPGLNIHFPLKKILLLFDIAYMSGNLNTFYKAVSHTQKNNLLHSDLLIGEIGISLPIEKNLNLDISYKSEYYYKAPKSPFYRFYYNPTDLWIQGLAATLGFCF